MFCELEKKGQKGSEILVKKFPMEVDRKVFPHDCPRCKSPAYVGFLKVECSNLECC